MFNSQVSSNSLSLAALPLQMFPYGSAIALAKGTGFFYEYEEILYLITNGHNVTGVNPVSNQRISNSMAFPERIKFHVRRLMREPELAFGAEEVFTPLYSGNEMKQPLWYVHPIFGYNVDVVAIPVLKKIDVPQWIKLFPINKFEFDDQFMLLPSDDVFILGYPFGIDGDKKLPIWKRGSVATEPSIDIDGLPKLLIDTASRPGMSGAPVIFKRSGLHGMTEGKLTNDTIIGTIRGFVGIYSGRIAAPDPIEAQLGVVWKKTVIEEILAAKVIGDIVFQTV
jgi:hypothetical protein